MHSQIAEKCPVFGLFKGVHRTYIRAALMISGYVVLRHFALVLLFRQEVRGEDLLKERIFGIQEVTDDRYTF